MKRSKSCDHFEVLLPDWGDGRLNPIESQVVEEHLKDCPHCTAEAKFWRQFAASVAVTLPPVNPVVPPGLARQIIAQVKVEAGMHRVKVPPVLSRDMVGIITGTVAAFLCVFLIVGLSANASSWEAAAQQFSAWIQDAGQMWMAVGSWLIAGMALTYAILFEELEQISEA